MIHSFADKQTLKVFKRVYLPCFSKNVQKKAYRKLLIIDAAERLQELRVPPGNRLEKLKGDRKGQYSIRINQRWRISFKWIDGAAHSVEIVDYHGS